MATGRVLLGSLLLLILHLDLGGSRGAWEALVAERELSFEPALMKCSWRTMMAAEEASSCQVPCRPWASIVRMTISVLIITGTCYLICNLYFSQQQQPDSTRDPRLRWQGDPALGRSFLHGPELDDDGQLRIQRDGIYRLHIQVTLANCSSSTWTAEPQRATLTVAICSPAAHSISLLRLSFQHGGCWVASQRLTFLARGDVLCTNLTLPLLPSRNADETFFGVQATETESELLWLLAITRFRVKCKKT
ncbi:CD70 [Cervus elaphus hippelaphus]|uniref:CD70 antigen n=1 Tax=Cervus elaphus hippelaphus TaxID=46360 RepID=A0A212D2K8_CEREH|nr:CD70 [Cervus elaphus hippelaphus]